MKQLFRSLPFKLAVGVGIGILFGLEKCNDRETGRLDEHR